MGWLGLGFGLASGHALGFESGRARGLATVRSRVRELGFARVKGRLGIDGYWARGFSWALAIVDCDWVKGV